MTEPKPTPTAAIEAVLSADCAVDWCEDCDCIDCACGCHARRGGAGSGTTGDTP